MFGHGKYIGARKELYGETVLIEELVEPIIQVQFDDVDKFDMKTDEHLAFGWHAFPKTDFQIFGEPKESVPWILRLSLIAFFAFWVTIAILVVRAVF